MKKNIEASIVETDASVDLQIQEYLEFDMSLPIQMLFDDVISFISIADM